MLTTQLRQAALVLLLAAFTAGASACGGSTPEVTAGGSDGIADANATIAQARQMIVENRLYEANMVLTDVIEKDPSNATALMLRGIAHMREGRLYPSVKDLKAAADLAPSADAYYNLGNALLQAGFFKRAVTAYRAALELAPDDPEILNNLGSALIYSQNNGEARQVLGRVVQLRPNDPQAYTLLGVLAERERDWSGAEQYFFKALEIAPDYWPAQFNLAKTYDAKGDEAAAMQEYRRYIEIRPNAPDRGKIMQRADMHDELY